MQDLFNTFRRPADVHLVTLDDVRLFARWYQRADSDDRGPCYLLGHGFTGSSARDAVVAIAQRLVERDAAVLSIDFRGHGRSEGRASVGVDETADVAAGVAWLRNRHRHRHRSVVLLGFSMGATVVIRHAGLGGDADAVIAVGGPGRWFVRSTAPMRRLNSGLETAIGRTVLSRLRNTRVNRAWAELPAAPVEVAARIAVPTLIVHGGADPYFGLEHPRMLHAEVVGSQLWIETGMGHAETATSGELLDRIDRWARQAVGLGPFEGERERAVPGSAAPETIAP